MTNELNCQVKNLTWQRLSADGQEVRQCRQKLSCYCEGLSVCCGFLLQLIYIYVFIIHIYLGVRTDILLLPGVSVSRCPDSGASCWVASAGWKGLAWLGLDSGQGGGCGSGCGRVCGQSQCFFTPLCALAYAKPFAFHFGQLALGVSLASLLGHLSSHISPIWPARSQKCFLLCRPLFFYIFIFILSSFLYIFCFSLCCCCSFLWLNTKAAGFCACSLLLSTLLLLLLLL